jgi:hypothetical protein
VRWEGSGADAVVDFWGCRCKPVDFGMRIGSHGFDQIGILFLKQRFRTISDDLACQCAKFSILQYHYVCARRTDDGGRIARY